MGSGNLRKNNSINQREENTRQVIPLTEYTTAQTVISGGIKPYQLSGSEFTTPGGIDLKITQSTNEDIGKLFIRKTDNNHKPVIKSDWLSQIKQEIEEESKYLKEKENLHLSEKSKQIALRVTTDCLLQIARKPVCFIDDDGNYRYSWRNINGTLTLVFVPESEGRCYYAKLVDSVSTSGDISQYDVEDFLSSKTILKIIK